MRILARHRSALLFIVFVFGGGVQLFAQGTAFTYQGRLNQGATPVTGLYDFQFTVRDAASGGSGLGTFPLSTTLPVTNGLFTVTLDPGAGVFTGGPRWLEIAVRTNGAGVYTTLIPRQPITPTPYAIRSAGAAIASSVTPGAVTAAGLAPGAVSQVSSPSGSITGLQVNASGLVAIGTNAPQAGLHVSSGSNIVAPRVLASFRDEVGGYTNLAGTAAAAVFQNLLALGANSDSGITLVDITDPQAPVQLVQFRDGELGFNKLLYVSALAMKTNLLVVAAQGTNTVTLIGVTNPATPVKLAELEDGVGGWNELSNPAGLAIGGNTLAIAATSDNAVTLADISNPSAPIKRVELRDGVFGFNSLSGAVAVAISGNILAIGAFYDNAVTLVDIADPSNPIKLSEIRDGVGGFNGLSNVFKVALSTNGLLAISGAYDNTVTLVDVSNPSAPVKLAELVDGVNGIDSLYVPTGVAFSGNWLAAVGAGAGAVTLFDVSIPSAPRKLAVMRDGVGGFDYLAVPYIAVFAGTNLVIPSTTDHAATLIGFGTASAGIVSQGRVGIGTTQPRAALDVVGDVIVDGAVLFDVNANRIELGIGSTASGSNAVAIGKDALATGIAATALGSSTKASGDYSTALGLNTKATGLYSFAAGNDTEASGAYSTALGGFSKASGDYSFALGFLSEASGYGSVSMGNYARATGQNGFALGDSTFATNYSFAAGTYARALHAGSFVWGDLSFLDFDTTDINQFLIRANNGVGINTNQTAGLALNVNGAVAVNGNVSVNGTVTATNFSGRFTGNGAGLTNVLSGVTTVGYISSYATGPQSVAVANTFQDMILNPIALSSGWVHQPGTANFSNNVAGIYLVQYTAQTETTLAGATTMSIIALLNGVEVNGSQCSTEPDTAGQTMPVSKSFLVTAPAFSGLKLQFTGTSVNNRIAPTGSGNVIPSASITIIRIQ